MRASHHRWTRRPAFGLQWRGRPRLEPTAVSARRERGINNSTEQLSHRRPGHLESTLRTHRQTHRPNERIRMCRCTLQRGDDRVVELPVEALDLLSDGEDDKHAEHDVRHARRAGHGTTPRDVASPRRAGVTRASKPFPSKQALLSTARGCGTALSTLKGKVYALEYFAKSRSSSLWSRQHTLGDGLPAVIECAFWPPKFVVEVFLRYPRLYMTAMLYPSRGLVLLRLVMSPC